jgi:hypothetical protein
LEAITNTLQNSVQEIHSNIEIFKKDLSQDKTVLNSIETKVDILAQTDYSEIFNFAIENLKKDLNIILEKLQNNSDFYNANSEDLGFLKENFYKINEKFSEITHLIRTNTAESEELNNRFESNITSFNSGFQNVYERFNNLDNTFKESFADFKDCIQDIYDQFSTIDNRADLDQVKFYVQSFNNKITSIAEILETLKENNFSLKIDSNEELIQEKTQEINEKIECVLDETKNFSNKLSDEISSLTSPLSAAIEMTGELSESIERLLAQDDMKIINEA